MELNETVYIFGSRILAEAVGLNNVFEPDREAVGKFEFQNHFTPKNRNRIFGYRAKFNRSAWNSI